MLRTTSKTLNFGPLARIQYPNSPLKSLLVGPSFVPGLVALNITRVSYLLEIETDMILRAGTAFTNLDILLGHGIGSIAPIHQSQLIRWLFQRRSFWMERSA